MDNEDCLYLNVYAPPGAGRGASRGHRLPVLFMIHGGGLTSGAGDQHDGSLIVNTDHIIVVSINYRLGPFGFLTLPGLGTSALTASGNYGLLDQEAALRWVQRNIAAFGGDPRQVTIDGESAGGWSVCALMTSPLARGLFRGAIMQSGSCATQTRATAEANSLAFAKQAGCPDAATAAACLRALPEQTLLNASTSYQPLFTSGGPELPVPAGQAVASGRYNRVPLLIGTNHNEGRTFSQGLAGLTEQQADQVITQDYGSRAPAILARYPWASYPSPYTAAYVIGDIWTDSGFITGIGGCPEQEPGRASSRRPRRRTSTSSTTCMRPGSTTTCPATSGAPGTRWSWPTCGPASTTASRCTTCSPRLSSSCPGRWSGTGARSPPVVRPRPAASRAGRATPAAG